MRQVRLDDSLQLPGVANSIGHDGTSTLSPLLLALLYLLAREIDATISNLPSTVLRELDNGAFALEEEKVLSAANWQRWVRALGTGCNLRTDAWEEDLWVIMLAYDLAWYQQRWWRELTSLKTPNSSPGTDPGCIIAFQT